jgi:hypothetical protein
MLRAMVELVLMVVVALIGIGAPFMIDFRRWRLRRRK